MVWLHPKKIKKKNEETLGSNFRGYTHTHTLYGYIHTKERRFLWLEGGSSQKNFPVGIYIPHIRCVEKKCSKKKLPVILLRSPDLICLQSMNQIDVLLQSISFLLHILHRVWRLWSRRHRPDHRRRCFRSRAAFFCRVNTHSTRHTHTTHTRGWAPWIFCCFPTLLCDNKSRPKTKDKMIMIAASWWQPFHSAISRAPARIHTHIHTPTMRPVLLLMMNCVSACVDAKCKVWLPSLSQKEMLCLFWPKQNWFFWR